ncbi:unnamed protein product [Allacma fusca]|uniref:Uncharacterized protein n=1 Tax=Allacma fusca TaxID=39272 RepID=A0A8J2JM03_9HEXA|nr:unnamed protein product [Allacma fusca]
MSSKNTKTFLVVYFTEVKLHDVIPSKWIRGEGKECKCPKNVKLLGKLQSKSDLVADENWKTWDTEVKYQSNTFLRAHKYSKCLQCTSYVETSESTGEENSNETRKRKRRPNPKYYQSPSGQEIPPKKSKTRRIQVYGSSSDEEQVVVPPVPRNLTPVYTNTSVTPDLKEDSDIFESSFEIHGECSKETFPAPTLLSTGGEDLKSKLRRFQEVVLSEQHSIKSDIEIIRSAVVRNNLSSKPKCPFRKPISSVPELQVAEEVLEEEKVSFKFWCISIGGTNAEDHVRRILKKLDLHEFSFEFNFTGKYGKKSFKKLSVCNIIIEVVIDSHKPTEHRIEEVIANW